MSDSDNSRSTSTFSLPNPSFQSTLVVCRSSARLEVVGRIGQWPHGCCSATTCADVHFLLKRHALWLHPTRRKVTMPSKLVAELKAHRARQSREKLAAGGLYYDQGFVFASPVGEPVSPDGVSHAFLRGVRGSEFDGLTLHALRHSHASQLIQAEVNIKTISERLGHSTITITLDLYGHLLPGMDQAAAEVVNAAL